MVYFHAGLVQNLGHINVFLELGAQLFQENLGTRRLALKLEGTLTEVSCFVLLALRWGQGRRPPPPLTTACDPPFRFTQYASLEHHVTTRQQAILEKRKRNNNF